METFLSKQDNCSLNSFRCDCRGVGVSPNDFASGIHISRKEVAILWKNYFDDITTPLVFDVDWIVGVKLHPPIDLSFSLTSIFRMSVMIIERYIWIVWGKYMLYLKI